MDITNEYILMCRGAYKDLGIPKSLELPTLWHEWKKSNLQSSLLLSTEGDGRYFPLYRQDQLQEIVKKISKYYENSNYCMLWDVYDFGEFNSPKYEDYSMEQLWLAFVMKEKYQKIWDNDKKEWINE